MFAYKRKSLLVVTSLAINAFAEEKVENYDSGKTRLINILSNEETGVGAYNKHNIHYAETRNLANDLNINEMAEFFDCKTLLGKSFIAETLKYPVSPEDRDTVLRKRQNVIKALVENSELKHQVDQLLEIAKNNEKEIIQLMSEFFIGQSCPELKQLELIKTQNPALYPLTEYFVLNPTGKRIGLALNSFSLVTMTAACAFLGKMSYHLAKSGLNYSTLATYSGYCGLMSAVTTYGLYKDYSAASAKRSKMHAINQFILIAEQIENLCVENKIVNQFNISEIQDVNGTELMQALKHSRYQKKNTLVFSLPAVHTFLYKMYQQEKHLAKIFACIAEMDAYNAIANKIIEAQNTNNQFCFVSFMDSEKPAIHAESFWNVLVKNAVTNSISEQKNTLLTGPNAGGKSTTIKALLQNILLGQSFGIAAASKFEFTMFDIIHSYINISDDILNGLSLFASEVKRAQEILQHIKSLQPNQKYFFALDELFTGTVAEDGEACAYEFVKRISGFDGVQFIYATHFNKLKELGNNEAYCINYKVDAPIKNDAGKLVYPYTLSQGSSDARVALDLAREAQLFA